MDTTDQSKDKATFRKNILNIAIEAFYLIYFRTDLLTMGIPDIPLLALVPPWRGNALNAMDDKKYF